MLTQGWAAIEKRVVFGPKGDLQVGRKWGGGLLESKIRQNFPWHISQYFSIDPVAPHTATPTDVGIQLLTLGGG